MRKYCVVLCCFLLQSGIAQPPTRDYQKGFDVAISAFNNQKYEDARRLFGSLTYTKHVNDLVPYSHYFHALSSLRVRQFADARLMLRQLSDRYPNWTKRSEAEYLLGNVLFEEENYVGAMEKLIAIDNTRLDADVQKLTAFYLPKCNNGPILRQLYEKYPNNPQVGIALLDFIQRTSTDKKDLELSDLLTNKYGSVMPQQSTVPSASIVANSSKKNRAVGKKSYYNVGVLFPFRMAELDRTNKAANNQYAIDLYEGIKLAVKKLQAEGIVINLFAYEVENNPDIVFELVNNFHFQQLDLLVGPLHSESYKVVSEWATANKVPIISPMSTNDALLTSNPYAYLSQASNESQSKRLLTFAKRFNNKNVAILYGNSKNDSLMAISYQKTAKSMGYEVLTCQRGTYDSYFGDIKPGHVLGAFSAKNTGDDVLRWANRNAGGAVVFAPFDAFDATGSKANQLSGEKLYLYDTAYPDEKASSNSEFRNKYLTRAGALPSSFAFLGYDTILFFGRMLGQYGTDIQMGVRSQAYREGYTTGGFDYRQTNDNQRLTILRYNNYDFEVVD